MEKMKIGLMLAALGAISQETTYFIMEHKPKVIGEIYYKSAIPPCLKCGVAYDCRRGGLWHHLVGCDEDALKDFKITPDKFRKWEDDPVTIDKVNVIGKLLSEI